MKELMVYFRTVTLVVHRTSRSERILACLYCHAPRYEKNQIKYLNIHMGMYEKWHFQSTFEREQ